MMSILNALLDFFKTGISSPAQIIGIIALIIVLVSFQQRTRKGILLLQCFSTALFTLHFALIGGYTGSALNFFSGVRSVIYYNKDKKWAKSIFWPVLFIIIFTAATLIIAFKAGGGIPWWYNLFPLFGAYVYTIATYTDSPKIIRRTLWLSSVAWIIYNLKANSVGGVITEIFALISNAVAILRFDVLGKKVKE